MSHLKPRRHYRLLLIAPMGVLILGAAGVWFAESLLIQPQHISIGAPPTDLPVENVSLHSSSGATIRGWFLPGTEGDGAILLLHGVRANRLAMLPRARWLHSLGYSVLLIDFQASGESSGDMITFGLREAEDARSAVAYLRRRLPGERVGAIGTSMGGAAILLANPQLDIDAAVLEQVYPSIDQASSDRLTIYLGGATWFTPVLLKTTSWRTGIQPAQLRPIDHIGALDIPKLIVAGDADRHTRLDESLAMYATAAAPKQLWIVKGAQHVDLYRFAGDDYRQRVGAFLERSLSSASAPASIAQADDAGRSGLLMRDRTTRSADDRSLAKTPIAHQASIHQPSLAPTPVGLP